MGDRGKIASDTPAATPAAPAPAGLDGPLQLLAERYGAAGAHRYLQRRRAQRAASPAPEPDLHATAAAGVSGAAAPLPHGDAIQRSFGRHDVSQVQAHTDGAAASAASAIGAEAYATGNHVAFAGAPSLHTAAHEAAHVVQQRGGVQLKGGVGAAGDPYERQADAVADQVVRGQSAEALLDQAAARGASPTAALQKRDSDSPAHDLGNGELDRRVDGDQQNADGSGDWGANQDDRGLTDDANWAMWESVANAAEAAGLTNAARHMRHYLDATGSGLTVDVDVMLRDVPAFAQAYADELQVAKAMAEKQAATLGSIDNGHNFPLTGERSSDVYCTQGQSRDWFFAVGGFTHWWTADVTVLPSDDGGPPEIQMAFTMNMHDRYNWDAGKAVTLAGLTVKDAQLGRLHRVGLAREFDIDGKSSLQYVTWKAGRTAIADGIVPKAADGAGGRGDLGRDEGDTSDVDAWDLPD